jgi:hypothetical protein
MNSSGTRKLDMFNRLHEFKLAHAAAFPAASAGGRLFAEVDVVIETLTTQAVAQSSGLHAAQQSTDGKSAARDALAKQMEKIARTARAMALDIPGLDEKFRLPRSKSGQALLTAAQTFRADAAPLQAEFIEQAMPADFLETLDTRIAGFEREIAAGHQSKAAHVAASAAIEAAIERGMIAAQKLDPIVRNTFDGDAATLAEWKSARRVEKTPRKSKKPTGPASPPNQP